MSRPPFDLAGIPVWVAWLAQDADGAWWGYEVEPLQHESGWYENEVGRCVLLAVSEPCLPWQNTLQNIGSKRTY